MRFLFWCWCAFRENLGRLLQDKHFKEEIVLFNISEETGVVNASHRATLIPLLMRYVVCFNGFICISLEEIKIHQSKNLRSGLSKDQ